jgi:NADPH:quinone reductase-like Zn-dependent oxidoreductase
MPEVGDSVEGDRAPRYGAPDVLELREVDKPAFTDDGVLVRVRARFR